MEHGVTTPVENAVNNAVRDAFERIRSELGRYTFTPQDEAALQLQVAEVLAVMPGVAIEREVVAERGRYDILIRIDGVVIVIELKVHGSAGEVERQAQRYAMTAGINGVAVVTTQQRLALAIRKVGASELGGKPFAVMALRGF